MPRPSLDKRVIGYMRWLVQRPELRKQPLSFLFKIFKWKLLTLVKKEPTIIFDGDIAMKSPCGNATASATYQLGYAEPRMFSFLSSYLKPGMIFCDVGANVGAYTLFAAKRVGGEGRVLAFEPAPPIFDYLIQNIVANTFNNIEAYNIALGKESRIAEFLFDDHDLGKSHILERTANRQLGLLMVETETLDLFLCRTFIGQIDYIKIDVEGQELAVLLGAKWTISSNAQMLIQTELLPHLACRYGLSTSDVAEFLASCSFVPHFVDESGLKLRQFAPHVEPVGDVIWIHGSNRTALSTLVAE